MSLTKEDEEILSSVSDSKTSADYYMKFNGRFSKKDIDFWCRQNSIPVTLLSNDEKSVVNRRKVWKHQINEDYFKTWSHNMAYIFGLWCADGCICNGRRFDITLKKKDSYLLRQIAKELGFDGSVRDYHNNQASRIEFSNKIIYNDIVALGGCERKSKVLEFPYVPDEYLNDYIRGYFDGDGCIMLLKGNRINSAFTCASKRFLDVLLDKLHGYANITKGAYDASCVSLKFGKRDSLALGQFMYKDNPELYLKRKKDKFDRCFIVSYRGTEKNPESSLLYKVDVETNFLNRKCSN